MSELGSSIAKLQIRDVLSRYRGSLDRMDRKPAYSVWHDDGTARYESSGSAFAGGPFLRVNSQGVVGDRPR
jgi:hypothetical protein